MTKIYHFPNLVCWDEVRHIIESYPELEHEWYCDSRSLHFFVQKFGSEVCLFPGVDFYARLNNKHDYLHMTAKDVGYECLVLPMFDSIEDIREFSSKCSIEHSRIILGISSPKQNFLAAELASLNPMIKEIFCLGAAVYDSGNNPFKYHWLSMLIENPKRGGVKLLQTLVSVVKIIFSNKKKCFAVFVNSPTKQSLVNTDADG